MSDALDGQNVVRHLQKLSVRTEQYKKAGVAATESSDARRSQAAEASKQAREALLTRKRLRQGPVDTVNEFSVRHVHSDSPQTKVQQLVDTLTSASLLQKTKLKAISSLRRLLSADDPPFNAAVQAGAGPCLTKALLLRQQSAIDLKIIFEAVWAITNMAAGPQDCVMAVLPAAPFLIVLLQTYSSTHIAEQSAWALGNMAGESQEVRQRLRANGAVRPLLQLVLAAKGQSGLRVLSTACTAAWALSNLLQDSDAMVKEVFAINGAVEGMIELLGASTSTDLVLEVAWALCHASFSQADVNRLVHLGLVKAVMLQVGTCLQAVSTSQEGVSARLGLLRPLLRIVANVAAFAGRDAATELLVPSTCADIVTLAHLCMTSEDAGLQAEAAWLCTNLAAMPDKPTGEKGGSHRGREALQQLLPILQQLSVRGGVMAQREATHAVVNLTVAGTQ